MVLGIALFVTMEMLAGNQKGETDEPDPSVILFAMISVLVVICEKVRHDLNVYRLYARNAYPMPF